MFSELVGRSEPGPIVIRIESAMDDFDTPRFLSEAGYNADLWTTTLDDFEIWTDKLSRAHTFNSTKEAFDYYVTHWFIDYDDMIDQIKTGYVRFPSLYDKILAEAAVLAEGNL